MDHSRPYEKLIAWQEAHQLCLCIYRTTKVFPADEKFELVNQMRRASSSVPMNIAEGNARRSKKDKAHFFEIAISSLEEVHYQCRLSFDLGYMKKGTLDEVNNHIGRTGYLLTKLRQAIA